jgi:deoxyribodipyrimidine photo-lyase
VVACFVVDPRPWATAGTLRRDLLLGHLGALDASLRSLGGALVVRHGDPADVVPQLARECGATSLHRNADPSAYSRRRDAAVDVVLGAAGVRTVEHWGAHVHPPGSLTSPSTGGVHRVFTPFSKAWSARAWDPWPEPVDAEVLPGPAGESLPEPSGPPVVEPGEDAAAARLADWSGHVDGYRDRKDVPGDDAGTSHLSADLRWGTLSPRTAASVVGTDTPGRAAFVRQLAWRDWYAHLLAEHPDLPRRAMNARMDGFPWRDDADGLAAWQEGRTGYPIVDAGMRQLATTGWMHNRVRLIAGSFLVKDLLVDWRAGEAHFRRLLVDWELSQNVGNWQWVAGTGPDAAPYFRVFNPVTQGRRFDPDGAYVRRWVPELAKVPDQFVHAPWEAGPLVLAAAGVELGRDYPEPIVDHAAARERALAAYERTRDGR